MREDTICQGRRRVVEQDTVCQGRMLFVEGGRIMFVKRGKWFITEEGGHCKSMREDAICRQVEQCGGKEEQ